MTMMPTVVKKKFDDLIDLLLTKGAQPNDLADNIFLQNYTSIQYRKMGELVIGELGFIELINGKEEEVFLRYFYDQDRRILKIEEQIVDKIATVWSRESRESELINEIVGILKNYYTSEQVQKVINTLPDQLRAKITDKYAEVA